MCVAFDPEVIYNNVFFSTNKTKLFKYDIVDFCSILEKQVTTNIKININYKHVYFDFDQGTIDSFFKAYSDVFNKMGNEIFITKKIEEEQLNIINSVYKDSIVIKALENARKIFCEKQIAL